MFRRGAGFPELNHTARAIVKRWIFFAAKAVVSGLLIWLLIDRVDVAPIVEAAGRMHPGPVALALAIVMLGPFFLGFRWMVVSRVLAMPLARGRAMWLTFVGQFFGQTLPSTIGGDVVRIWFMRRDGVPVEQAAISVILDRFCALATSLTIVALSLPKLLSLVDDPVARWSMPVLVVLGFGGIAFLLLLGGPAANLARRLAPLRPFVAFGAAGLRLARSGMPALTALLLAAVIIGCTILAIWLIGKAVATELSLLHCLVLVPPVVFISMIPVSIAGWGVREGAMVIALGFVSVPAADALVISLTFGMLVVATGIPGGILWLLSGQRLSTVS
jgi:uncharacterized membrane protein YbhN (UPF0104 family)